ncbi:MAG: NADH-quinone oxidoreductase subunit N, partial [Plesiomonas shigelloides]
MALSLQSLVAELPLIITGLTVVLLMLLIAWQRHHLLVATVSVVGLNLALLSLFICAQVIPVQVTTLLQVDGYTLFFS